MKNAWVAAALSLVTVAGGHFYNRRPYVAMVFLFAVVALQSFVNALVPLLLPLFDTTDGANAGLWMALARIFVLLLAAIVSAGYAFADARALRVTESENLRVVSSITGTLVGLSMTVMAVVAVVTMLRFSVR